MSPRISRREFVRTAAAAGVGAAAVRAPAVLPSKGARPVVVASANGNLFKNGGPRTCVQEAWERIVRGEDVLDALVAGVTIVELDPEEDSVGYGGRPNADGVVQLDASCIHGPKRRAGAVAALEGVRTAAQVARAVLEQTDHHLLAGKGAQDFAREMGFPIEADLNTEKSRRQWLEWKRSIDPSHWLDPAKRAAAGDAARRRMIERGLVAAESIYGTIHCSGVNAKGEICGTTTTSGLAWKIPGRVGDSPILGAGNYVADGVGAAGSTGRGEANLFNLSSFAIVEALRRGDDGKDAAMAALRRIAQNTVERRLLDESGRPNFQVKFYVLDARGRHAGVAMRPDQELRYSVCDEGGPRHQPLDVLFA